jgi:hypothetical protein
VLAEHDAHRAARRRVAFLEQGEEELLLLGVMAPVGEVLREIDHVGDAIRVHAVVALDRRDLALHRRDDHEHELVLLAKHVGGSPGHGASFRLLLHEFPEGEVRCLTAVRV